MEIKWLFHGGDIGGVKLIHYLIKMNVGLTWLSSFELI